MVVLAVDTSTNVCTAALMKDRGPAHEISVEVRSGHSGRLLPVIDTLFGLSPFSKEDVGLITVGVGPGSFTGIRIAIATQGAFLWPWDARWSGRTRSTRWPGAPSPPPFRSCR